MDSSFLETDANLEYRSSETYLHTGQSTVDHCNLIGQMVADNHPYSRHSSHIDHVIQYI